MGRLDGKVALITGGARGQGAAEAELFVAEGATVVISDVLDDEGRATAARIGTACRYEHHDVTDEEGWEALVADIVAAHGRLDVLVNNAGIFEVQRLEATSLDDWNRMVAINQTGVFLGMRSVAPTMTTARSGSIINISSVAGLGGVGMAFTYSATKWAVRGMTKSAAQDLSRAGVRVNSVHPGYIETPMFHQVSANTEALEQAVPLGRVADADEVARVVLFLASDESGYCTGHEFVVDGGLTA
ncbi:MAG: glucose 1-dehydrogenase [Actinomycetota bacterium]